MTLRPGRAHGLQGCDIEMPDFLFQNWGILGRTLIIGVAGYVALIAILRLSGKRTLAKMNAFDFIVTIALGSTLSALLISPDVALAEGVLALALLVGLQLVTAWASSRYSRVKGIVTAEPTLLVLRGDTLPDALRRERVAAMEVHQAARQQGYASLHDVEAMVLESDGTFSVIGRGAEDVSALESVPAYRARDGSAAADRRPPAGGRGL